MKKAFLILLIPILLPFSSYSQIGNEIRSYVDSTELLVQNGRRMILRELNNGNLVKTKEIYTYLSQATENELYSAFYYVEDLYINMLVADWEEVNRIMLQYDKLSGKVVYPNSQEIISKLYEMISDHREAIADHCENSQINDEAKMLISILFQYLEKGSSDLLYNEKLDAYNKKYEVQKYESFKTGFLPKKIIKTSWNYSFGSGMVFPTKDLASSFSNNATFNFGMDFNIHKVFTSFHIQGTNLKLKQAFTTYSEYDSLSFKLNEKFSYFEGGVKVGYFLIRSNRFHVTPYLSISGSTLESTKFKDPEDDDLEYVVFNSFTYGAGLHTEVKLYEYENKGMYYYGSNTGFLSLKLDAGYNKIAKFEDDYARGDTPYFICAFVIGFGKF
jgi:hypothetical protein